MTIVADIVASAHRWLTQPRDEMTRMQRSLRFAADLARYCAKKMRDDRAPQMAAALTYHTLFSLLPTLVLMLVALNVFVDEGERDQFKQTAVNWVVDALQRNDADAPAEVMLTQEDEQTIAAETEGDVAAINRREFDEVRQRLDEQIQGLLDQLEQVKFGSIGVVGVLVFFYGATALLATTERSFNAIFGVGDSRHWLLRLPLYFTTIVLAPLLLIATQVFQNRLFDVLDAAQWSKWALGPLAYIAPLCATWLVLWVIYVLLPKTRVSVQASLVGAGVAAIGWGITKELFRMYVGNAAGSTLYGALGVLPLFLLWLFLSWLIILFGLEISYTLQAMGALGGKHQLPQAPPWVQQQTETGFDPKWTLPIMALVGRRFQSGETVTPVEIATKLRLPGSAVHTLCQALKSQHLLNRVPCDDEQDGVDGYALAKPPNEIMLSQLLDVGDQQSVAFDHTTPGQDVLVTLRNAQHQAMDGKTLDDLISGKTQ